MANRTGRARRRRSGALSVAQAEAQLSDDVRRRLRAGARASEGRLPGPPDKAQETEGWLPSPPDKSRETEGGAPAGQRVRHSVPDLIDPEDAAEPADRMRMPMPMSMVTSGRGHGCAPACDAERPAAARAARRRRRAVSGGGGRTRRAVVAALAVALFLTWVHRPQRVIGAAVHRSACRRAPWRRCQPDRNAGTRCRGARDGRRAQPGAGRAAGGARVDDAVSAAGGATRKARPGQCQPRPSVRRRGADRRAP